jgi:L-ascorbate metabolism protein UlaG (beta-lactamase superfamily)
MQVRITYIHHSCFCLRFWDRLLLFDCPGPEHRGPEVERILHKEISGSRVLALFSHSHKDHFAEDIQDILHPAAEASFLVADDVADLYEHLIPQESLVAEPGITHMLEDLSLSAFASNDMGVAFFIRKQGTVIYFGGDLAHWEWPGLTRAARRAGSIFFQGMLEELKQDKVHVAFSNADPRLDNLSGAPRFLEQVRPDLFVPLHSFGRTEQIRVLQDKIPAESGTRLFLYQEPGDSLTADIGP